MISETRVSGMVSRVAAFISAVKKGQDSVATLMSFGTPMEWKPYSDFRPTVKREDYEYPCCVFPNDRQPTKFPLTKFTGNIVYEAGLLGQKRVGLSMILLAIPQTKTIENITGIGDKIDSYFARLGVGCNLRALIEGSGTGSVSYWDTTAPCLKCSISVNVAGTVIGGGGVQCGGTWGTQPGGIPSVQGSVQAWGKLSPIGYVQDCTNGEGKLTWGALSACVQLRLRYYDWLDIERQYCTRSVSLFGA